MRITLRIARNLLRPGTSDSHEGPDLSPGAPLLEGEQSPPLGTPEHTVRLGDHLAHGSDRLEAVHGVVDSDHQGGLVAEGGRERFSHGVSVGGARHIFKTLLTAWVAILFNGVLKPRGTHSYRTQSDVCLSVDNGPDTATPTSQAGPHHQVSLGKDHLMATSQGSGAPVRPEPPTPDLTSLFLSCAESAAERGADVEQAVTSLTNSLLRSAVAAATAALSTVTGEAVAA